MTQEEIAIELSESILSFLLKYRETHNNFTFWLRNKDSIQSETKRLENGYWFQGTEEYIFISFYGKGDNNNRTRSIGVVVIISPNESIDCYLEVVWGSSNNNSPQLVAFYNDVCRTLGLSIKKGETKYQKYYGKDVFEGLKLFIENDKKIIDQLIGKHDLEKTFFITESKFQSMLSNTQSHRERLKKIKLTGEQVNIKTGQGKYTINDVEEGVIGVSDLASEVAKVIRELGGVKRGNMFGIFGQWGIGKTFLMDQVWKILQEDSTIKSRVDFHAWKYQDTPASWAYLYEEFSKKYFEEVPKQGNELTFDFFLRRKFKQILKSYRLNTYRLGYLSFVASWISIVFLGFFVCFMIQNGSAVYDTKDKVIIGICLTGTIAFGISGFKYLAEVFNYINVTARFLFNRYYKKPSLKGHLGVQAEIQTELRNLLMAWINNSDDQKIVLFVDDIDRCNEERIIQIIDALRIMLEDEEISKRVVVIAAIDERVLKRAIQGKYFDLINKDFTTREKPEDQKDIAKTLIREYMDKLFISGIKLTSLTIEDRKEVFRAFAERFTEGYGNNTSTSTLTEPAIIEESTVDLEEENTIVDTLTLKDSLSITVETSYEISKKEFDRLSSYIEIYAQATPRQIKILYYRYQLARNIFSLVHLSDEPLPTEHVDYLIMFLIQYSALSSIEEISHKRIAINDSDNQQQSFEILRSNTVFPKQYLLSILKVIETVVAY